MASDLETRLRKVEQALLLGGAGRVPEELQIISRQLSTQRFQEVNGNVLGGPLRTDIGPFFSYIGPFVRDVDSNFALEFDLPLPNHMLRIKNCNLHVALRPIRSSVSVAEAIGSITSSSGGGQTSSSSSTDTSGSSSSSSSGASSATSSGSSSASTTNSGGGQTSSSTTTPSGGGSTSGASSASTSSTTTHAHSIDLEAAATESNNGHQHAYFRRAGTTDLELPHSHGITHTHSTPNHTHPGHTHTVSNHDHGMAHTHNIEHTHGISHTHGIDHTHDVIDHTHDVDGHGHDLTLAIAEGGSASGVRIIIDGVDRTTALGGPWDTTFDVDIRQYLINARLEPLAGTHSIKFTTQTVGALEVTGYIYGIIKPPVG